MTPERLVDELALCARPSVRGYRDDVVSRARGLGVSVAVRASTGPVAIDLDLPESAQALSIGWRVNAGWYFARLPGELPVRYLMGPHPLDVLLPRSAAVATWLHALNAGRVQHGAQLPPLPASGADEVTSVLCRLHRYIPVAEDMYACWSHRPLR